MTAAEFAKWLEVFGITSGGGSGGSVAWSDVTGKPTFAAVATSGAYVDLSGTPAAVTWSTLSGKPTFAAVATSGAYADLSGKPTIPAAQVNADWSAASGVSQILNKPALATVATSGAYGDLSGRPAIPAAQVNADWSASSGVAQILNKPTIGKAVVGTTVKSDSFRVYQNATVASGVAVFQLTADGTAGGAALFANEVYTDSVQVIVSDALASYQMSWAFSNSNKTLTVTCNKYTTASLLTGVLGQSPANGTVVRLCVEGR